MGGDVRMSRRLRCRLVLFWCCFGVVSGCFRRGSGEDGLTMFSGIACRSWMRWFLDSAPGLCNSCLGCMCLPV